jgi:5'-phosphate synthase pdxT subunit
MIGVLALQGNFAMHAAACEKAGARVQLVKNPQQLQSIQGLILPGGESTVMLKHFELQPAWWPALKAFHAAGKGLFGTCAGLILLAQQVSPAQKSLGFLDVSVERNAYGRQIDSHEIHARFDLNGEILDLDMPFIRAPKITRVGPEVTPVGWVDGQVVMVQQGRVLGAACHPEAATHLIHRHFISINQ